MGDCQSEPHSFPAAAIFSGKIWIEYVRHIFFRNPDPFVRDDHLYVTPHIRIDPFRADFADFDIFGADRDYAAPGHGFTGVFQQAAENLVHLVLIYFHFPQVRGALISLLVIEPLSTRPATLDTSSRIETWRLTGPPPEENVMNFWVRSLARRQAFSASLRCLCAGWSSSIFNCAKLILPIMTNSMLLKS